MVLQTARCLACTGRPHAPRRGIGVRTRWRHLAARACCAPRKWHCGLICAPRKWCCRPSDALPVLAARTPPGGALACAPGGGTLPPALVVRRVNGIAALFVRRVNGVADRPMPCLCWPPARPPEGHWRAHPAAASCRRRVPGAEECPLLLKAPARVSCMVFSHSGGERMAG